MKTVTKVGIGLSAAATMILQSPSVQAYLASLVHSHPHVAAVLAGVASIVALSHDPKSQN